MLLVDDVFQVPFHRAVEAVKCGSTLIAWCNNDNKRNFFKVLIDALETCFKPCRAKERENVERVLPLRTSNSFTKERNKFLRATMNRKPSPTFFQYVSNCVF